MATNPLQQEARVQYARSILQQADLRPTRQRLALTSLLFDRRGRHVSAESLFAEAVAAGAPGSLSCVYNTPRRFHDVGLIRRVPIYGSITYYDTDLNDHHHFHLVDEDRLIDLPGDVSLGNLPPPPLGYELLGAELVLKVRRTSQVNAATDGAT